MPCPGQLSCLLHSFVIYKQLRLIALHLLSIRVEFNAPSSLSLSLSFFSLSILRVLFSSFFSPLLAFLFFFSFRPFQRTPSNGQGLFSSLMRFESTTKRFTRNGNFFPFRIFQAQSSKMSQFFDRIPFVNAFVRNEIVIRRRFDGLANIFVDELNESLD